MGVTAAVVVSVVHSLNCVGLTIGNRQIRCQVLSRDHWPGTARILRANPYQRKPSATKIVFADRSQHAEMRAVPGSSEIKLDRQLHLSRRVD